MVAEVDYEMDALSVEGRNGIRSLLSAAVAALQLRKVASDPDMPERLEVSPADRQKAADYCREALAILEGY
jgi:hypothetical protein